MLADQLQVVGEKLFNLLVFYLLLSMPCNKGLIVSSLVLAYASSEHCLEAFGLLVFDRSLEKAHRLGKSFELSVC